MMEAHLFENMGFEAKARLRKHAFRSSNWASTTLDHEMRFDMLALYMYLLPDISMFAVIGLPSCNCWYINTQFAMATINEKLPQVRNRSKACTFLSYYLLAAYPSTHFFFLFSSSIFSSNV